MCACHTYESKTGAWNFAAYQLEPGHLSLMKKNGIRGGKHMFHKQCFAYTKTTFYETKHKYNFCKYNFICFIQNCFGLKVSCKQEKMSLHLRAEQRTS